MKQVLPYFVCKHVVVTFLVNKGANLLYLVSPFVLGHLISRGCDQLSKDMNQILYVHIWAPVHIHSRYIQNSVKTCF